MSDTFYKMQADRDETTFLFGPFRRSLQERLKNLGLERCNDCGIDVNSKDDLLVHEEAEVVHMTEETPGEAEFQYIRWLFDYNELLAEAVAKKLGIQITQPGEVKE